jgi:hypothetical protein
VAERELEGRSGSVTLRLRDLAHGKSGDKGDTANVGVIALDRRWYPVLAKHVTPEAVNRHLRRPPAAPTEVYRLPRLGALNVVLHEFLTGGGTASLRVDALGKNVANLLFDMEIVVDAADLDMLATEGSR